MKICLISFFYYPYDPGGASIVVRNFAESLKKRSHDVFVITTGPKTSKPFSEDIQNGIKVYRFYPFGTWIPLYKGGKISNIGRIFTFLLNFWNPHTYFIIKKILKKENPDVVHLHEVLYLSLSVYSAANSLNLPIVSTIHSVSLLFPFNNLIYLDKIAGIKYPFLKDNYKIYEIISPIYRNINKIVINSTAPDIIIFITRAIKKMYLKYNLFKSSKNIVFPNMIDINNINLKNEKTINKKTFDIMYCGGFQRHKGGQTLIKAFRKIENQNIRLHIFGGGLKDVEKYFKKLAAGDERIIFYGYLPNNELQKFYKLADVTVVPSEYFENFSTVIIESFRAGVPVIGSNVGGNPELIKERYNGFLFEPGNVEQLKEILEYVILNRNKLKEMSENCINTAKKYSAENNIHKLEEIFKEAIKFKQKR